MEKNLFQRLVYDFWYFAWLVWGRIYLRLRFYNWRNVPRTGGVIVIANHQSFLDPPLVGISQWRQMYFMARSTLFRGMFGWLLRTLGSYPVDQEKNGIGAIKETLRLLKKGQAVVIFPEGSRSYDGKLQPFFGGILMVAKRSGVPIVPCAVNGAYNSFPRGAKIPKPCKVTVTFGELIPPETIQQMSQEELRDFLTTRVTELLWPEYRPEVSATTVAEVEE